MNFIDPKVALSAAGAAISGLAWFLLGKLVLEDWTAEEITTAAGFSTTIVVFILGYITPNASSPVKGDGEGAEFPEDRPSDTTPPDIGA